MCCPCIHRVLPPMNCGNPVATNWSIPNIISTTASSLKTLQQQAFRKQPLPRSVWAQFLILSLRRSTLALKRPKADQNSGYRALNSQNYEYKWMQWNSLVLCARWQISYCHALFKQKLLHRATLYHTHTHTCGEESRVKRLPTSESAATIGFSILSLKLVAYKEREN